MKKLIFFIALASLAFGFSFDMDSKNGAIQNTKELGLKETITLNLQNDNAITGADYDEGKKQFALVSNDNEFYIADENLKPVSYAKHDRHFIMEMEATVGASWYKNELGMISYNKTFVFYEPASNLGKDEQNSQWRHLLAGYDAWKLNDLGNKGRFSTIRSKQQYILGWDYLESENKFFTASVPNDVRDYWSVTIFDGDDKMILEEFVPKAGANLQLKEGRNLNNYYITGIDAEPDALYLLSKNFSTILKLNLTTKEIDEAFSFSGVNNPRALAIKDNKFYIFSREGKENKVFIFEMK
ncbi:hypothetical protein [Campylobacter concisus]|jgi:hypothetical protein CCC13826_2314|uniref:hypothetical protein n=1 Tax=Campylobacter concisus TaxID=199 RepID=UPI000D2FD33F|nr:hypothetical protein [Campylobacter concisus]